VPRAQEFFASQPGGKWTVERIKAGHNPFVSHPEELAELLAKAAELAVQGLGE
jgi:hypothetical protein